MGHAVLIVEDDERLGSVLQRSLERAGHRVTLARSLATARIALAAATNDVLLLDVELPDGTGWDLLREKPNAGMFVVVMLAGQPARRRLDEFQPACFLGKPFAIDTLLAIVDRVGARVE